MSLWDKTTTEKGAGVAGWPSKANPGSTSQSAGAAPASSGGESAPSPAPAAFTAATSPTAAKGGKLTAMVDRDAYWANKEARDLEKERVYRDEDIPAMRRSTAYQAAATLASTALAHDVLSFGSVAKGKKLDMYLGFVDLIAAHVADRLTNGFEVTPSQEGIDDASETQGGSIEE